MKFGEGNYLEKHSIITPLRATRFALREVVPLSTPLKYCII
jgi:hypothetical protein